MIGEKNMKVLKNNMKNKIKIVIIEFCILSFLCGCINFFYIKSQKKFLKNGIYSLFNDEREKIGKITVKNISKGVVCIINVDNDFSQEIKFKSLNVKKDDYFYFAKESNFVYAVVKTNGFNYYDDIETLKLNNFHIFCISVEEFEKIQKRLIRDNYKECIAKYFINLNNSNKEFYYHFEKEKISN